MIDASIAVLILVFLICLSLWVVGWMLAEQCPRCHSKQTHVHDRWENGQIHYCGNCRHYWPRYFFGRD